jgi:hypothetical protein
MSDYPIRQQRPAAATVLGILHLIFGILSLGFAICGGAMQLAGANPFGAPPGGSPFGKPPGGGAGPEEAMTRALQEIPGQKAVTIGQLGIDVVLDVMLIVGGVGLLQMRPFGRTISLVYAILSILNHVFAFAWSVFQYTAISEALNQLSALPAGPIFVTAFRFGFFLALIINLLAIAYPIIVLCFMLSAKLTAAFAGEGQPPALPDAPSDYDAGWGTMRRDPSLPAPPPGTRPDDRYKPAE